MKARITTLFFLVFSLWIATSAYAEDIYEPAYSSYDTNLYSDTTDIINSDIGVRVGGSFNYIYYPVSKQFGNEIKEKSLHYSGGGADITLTYCRNSHCGFIDQDLSAIYTYKGSKAHFLGSTHIGYQFRLLVGNMLLIQAGAGLGLTYASNSDDIEKKVFAGNGIAISAKLYIVPTIFFTRDIGVGIHLAPFYSVELGVENNSSNTPQILGLDAGIHLMLKY